MSVPVKENYNPELISKSIQELRDKRDLLSRQVYIDEASKDKLRDQIKDMNEKM